MIKIEGHFVTFLPPDGAAFLIGDFTDWDETPFPVNGPLTIEFPKEAYIEYAFLDANKRPLADLSNPVMPINPWYEYHRSIRLPQNNFKTPLCPQNSCAKVNHHTLHSKVFGSERTYYVYEPPTYPVVTIYVQDGEAFYQKLHFERVAAALLEKGLIQPVRLVMIEPEDRHSEYWFNHHYETFLIEEILPTVEHLYGVTATRGLWGASLGGLVSAWLAWRNDDLFSTVASQSGCFTADPNGGNEYHDPEWFTEQFAKSPIKPLRFYMQTGQIEWLLAPNRRFAGVLADKTYPHSYQELPSGHNWATWEQGLEPGLLYLFGCEDKKITSNNPTILNYLSLKLPHKEKVA